MAVCTNVWRSNLSEQVEVIASLRNRFPVVGIDTEFPGFICSTPRKASEEDRYRDVKTNVDNMHLIQLGLALFDEDGNTPWPGCCWQFNFSDFDPDVHASSPNSIQLLRRSGHDLDKYRRDGIPAELCYMLLRDKLFFCSHRYESQASKYITFHGLYDLAYLIKLITGGAPLPATLTEFVILTRDIFGAFFDVKHIAETLLSQELGLAKTANLMKVELEGIPLHQAGYDSLVIGRVFAAMKLKYEIDDEKFVSVLYGLESMCLESKKMMVTPYDVPLQIMLGSQGGFLFPRPPPMTAFSRSMEMLPYQVLGVGVVPPPPLQLLPYQSPFQPVGILPHPMLLAYPSHLAYWPQF